jgi:predicted metal-dependent phosphoesterase TrpH
MHSYEYTVENARYAGWGLNAVTTTPENFVVHHNSDYSGDVKVQLDTHQLIERLETQGGVCFINLPYDLLEQIVMTKLRNDLISKVEEMDLAAFKKFLQEVF